MTIRMGKNMKYERVVQYHETDAMRIVHHSNYVKWFEEARTDLLNKLGIGYDKMEEAGISSPVVSIQCQYKQPVRYGETVIIETKLKEYKGVKAVMEYTVREKETQEVRATGESSHCFLDDGGKILMLSKTHPEIDHIFKEQLQK